MVKERERVTIAVDPGSERTRALEAVDDKEIILVSDGRRYVIDRASVDPADSSDREAFREALRTAGRIFTPEEAERLEQDIYRWREEGTRPLDRP
jgi:hypothetical protein